MFFNSLFLERVSQLFAAILIIIQISTSAQQSRGELYRGTDDISQRQFVGRSNNVQTQSQSTNGGYQQQQQQQGQYFAPARGTPQYNTQSYQQSYYSRPNVEIVSVPLVNSIVIQDRNDAMQGDQPQQNPTTYRVSLNTQLNDGKPTSSIKDRFTASTAQYNPNVSYSEFPTRAPPTQHTQITNVYNTGKPTKKPSSIDDRINVDNSDKYAELARSVELFSNDLFYEMHSVLGENFMMSPFSIYTLLLLIAEGAEGESLNQITSALKVSDLKSIREKFRLLNGTLSAPSDGVILSQFNALITDTNRPVPREYEETMERIYKADVIPVDYTAANVAYDTINSYVSDKTRGQIRKIVRPEDVIKVIKNFC